MTHTVTGEVAFVKTEEGTVRLSEGDPVPSGVNPARLQKLVEAGVIAADQPQPGRVDQVKADVGDDPDKARAALDAELALPDKDQRPSLVKHLNGIIDAG